MQIHAKSSWTIFFQSSIQYPVSLHKIGCLRCWVQIQCSHWFDSLYNLCQEYIFSPRTMSFRSNWIAKSWSVTLPEQSLWKSMVGRYSKSSWFLLRRPIFRGVSFRGGYRESRTGSTSPEWSIWVAKSFPSPVTWRRQSPLLDMKMNVFIDKDVANGLKLIVSTTDMQVFTPALLWLQPWIKLWESCAKGAKKTKWHVGSKK